MSIFEWVYPWLVVSSPLLVGFICREWFKIRLTESVKHEYIVKVEQLRSELKQKETLLNDKIERESQRVTWLSSGALSNSASRQEQFFKRRLDSVDRLWAVVIEARKYRMMVAMLTHLNIDNVFKLIETDPSQAQKFKASGFFNIDDDFTSILTAHASRPYVTILTWAYYTAFEVIITHAATTAQAITQAIPRSMLDDDQLRIVLKTALPESAEQIDKFKSNQCYGFIQNLEDKIMWSIQTYDLKGQDLDDSLIEQARKIIDITETGNINEAARKAAVASQSI